MSTIKNLIATALFTSVAAVSFAQAPAAPKDAVPTTPAAMNAPAVKVTTKHTVKKVEEPKAKDAAAVTPTDAASKPAHTVKKVHKAASTKKADKAAPAASDTK